MRSCARQWLLHKTVKNRDDMGNDDDRSIEKEYFVFKTVTVTSREHHMFFVLRHHIFRLYGVFEFKLNSGKKVSLVP